MGIPVPFLELSMDPSETRFARAVRQAGCRGDLMGRPDREGGHRVAWIVQGVDGQRASAMEAMLRQSYAEVRSVDLDLAKRRWIGAGRLLDEDVRSPTLHAYIDVEDRFEAPWVHVAPDLVCLRLLPRSDLELFVYLGHLKHALQSRNVAEEPRIRHHSLHRYDQLRHLLESHLQEPLTQ